MSKAIEAFREEDKINPKAVDSWFLMGNAYIMYPAYLMKSMYGGIKTKGRAVCPASQY